ncbi:MAG: hypothetical protein N2322_07220 [Terrimicrobiaceae bacterium]|nr:hypothetical protein [Terrimicrobiaceae bacterium]
MSEPNQKTYAGTFERSMDAKKRVAVPSQWLEKKEGEDFYVLPDPRGQYLIVMPPGELRRWAEKIEGSIEAPARQRLALRAFYGQAHQVATDGQGRILLPEAACEAVGLKGAVVFVGGMSRFEVWDKERYAAWVDAARETYLEVAEAIGL